jgi:hypothetical protein
MKASPKLQLVMSPTEPSKESVVDEYYKLDAQVKAFAPIKNRHEKLRGIILSWFPDEVLPANQDSSVSGIEGRVLIGPRSMEHKPMNVRKIFKLVGPAAFFDACREWMTIKWMNTSLGEQRAQSFLVEEQTGSRKLTAIPNLPAEPAKAA